MLPWFYFSLTAWPSTSTRSTQTQSIHKNTCHTLTWRETRNFTWCRARPSYKSFISSSSSAHYHSALCKSWWRCSFWANSCWWSSGSPTSSDTVVPKLTNSLTLKQSQLVSSTRSTTRPSTISTSTPRLIHGGNNDHNNNSNERFCIILYFVILAWFTCY